MGDLSERKKITVNTLRNAKLNRKKICAITAYDYPTAVRCDEAGIDWILVGDSMGMTVFGYKTTIPMTIDVMLPHAEAVCRGVKYGFVVGDMPFMSYQASDSDAVKNAGKFIRCGCSAVKLEGNERIAPRIKAISDADILVMGHIGMMPQSLAASGGYKIQGKDDDSIEKLVNTAKEIEKAGAFAILVEGTPPEAGKRICEAVKIPVYGIGAGPDVDGQLLIYHDVMGSFEGEIGKSGNMPKFAKRYADVGGIERKALAEYVREVKEGIFPDKSHCY